MHALYEGQYALASCPSEHNNITIRQLEQAHETARAALSAESRFAEAGRGRDGLREALERGIENLWQSKRWQSIEDSAAKQEVLGVIRAALVEVDQ